MTAGQLTRRARRRSVDRVTAVPGALVHLLVLVLIGLVALADAARPGFSLAVFYLLPVGLAAWRIGRPAAIAWAAVAAIGWLWGAFLMGAAAPAAYWNAVAWLLVFLVVGVTVSGLRSLRDFTRSLEGTDALTGVLDGRSFQELVELERNRSLRYNRPFTVAYLDVDRLRKVNDLLGHATGDRTLHLIAQTIRGNLRSMDSVARLGGDEFALLLPETGRGAAEVALAKIRSCLDEVVQARDLPITFSIGAVICVGAPESVDRLIQRADALMYQAKDSGGDGLAIEVLDDPFGIEAILQRS